MRLFQAIMVLAAFNVLACGTGSDQEEGAAQAKDTVRATTRPATVTLDGFYIFAHETNIFRPCGSDTFYWVVGNRRTVEGLKMRYAQIAIEPLEEVFCQFRGWLLAEPYLVEGSTITYDGQAHVEELLVMRKRTAEDCAARSRRK